MAGACLKDFLQKGGDLIRKNVKVCRMRCDNAEENIGGEFLWVMEAEKIDKDFSILYSSQHNGISGRINGTKRKTGKIDAVLLYVDDMLIVSNSSERLIKIRSELCKVFKMKNLGEPEKFLGMEIHRDSVNKIIVIKQEEYTKKYPIDLT